MKTIGYILAGGGSTRFGGDKALAKMGDKTLIQRTSDLVREAAGEVAIVGGPDRYELTGVRRVADLWPGEGPLGGIITCLVDANELSRRAEWALIVSCDMPFLTADWLRFLVRRAAQSDADVLVARSRSGLEPLCACWKTNAAKALRSVFEEGVRKISDALQRLRTEVLDEEHWKRFDTAGRLFWNMNTPADYEEARRAWELRKS